MDIELDGKLQGNYYADLVQGQKFAIIPDFTLECGRVLKSVPVAYKTWGRFNDDRDNVLVLCHALSGSSDAEDWWRPLMGLGRTFDYDRFFIFCANLLGSPYGSASPLTIDPDTKKPYGPNFPITTIRDDVRIQKLVLDSLEVKSVAAVVGGSMGGMAAIEWPLCSPPGYVRMIIPIATSAYQGAWGIAWNNAQIRCIRADSQYQDGWYDPTPSGQPIEGLGAARLIAMLTYRSHPSFEARFSRRCAVAEPDPDTASSEKKAGLPTRANSHWEGSISEYSRSKPAFSSDYKLKSQFAAQSYMNYQADKFLKRFDANCYIHLVDKMDSHDITDGRTLARRSESEPDPGVDDIKEILSRCPPHALVVSIASDVLFTATQQAQLAEGMPDATLVSLPSSDGHDGFLLEFEALGGLIDSHLRKHLSPLYLAETAGERESTPVNGVVHSVFGEAEPQF